jgi:hypothetical protein
MKIFLIAIASVFVISGCIGAKRYTHHVKEVYKAYDTTAIDSLSNISITYDGPTIADPTVKVEKGQSYFVPALVYWVTKETYNCELNANLPIRIISRYTHKYVDTFGIYEKLKGRRLVLNIKSVPNKFTYTYKGDVIFLLLFSIHTWKQTIFPDVNDLIVAYQVYDGQNIVKEGNIEIRNTEMPLTNNKGSRKKITKYYITQYRQNIRMLSDQFLMELANQL